MTAAVADFREHGLIGIADGTAKMYRSKSGHAIRLLGELDAGSLTRDNVTGYIAARAAEGAKAHTISKELVTLRKVLAFAESKGFVAAGWSGAFPRYSPAYEPRDRWLTEDEYERLLDACEPERRLFVRVLVFTGARLSEALRLDWSDVDLATGFVRLVTAKSRHGKPKKPRFIPVSRELRKHLKQARGIGPIFVDPWANPALMLTRVARAAGIVGPTQTLNNNDLRRTFASWTLQQGATVKEVADLLGHGSTAMVERVYGHLARQNLVAAVGRLPTFRKRKARRPGA